jgi:hypothetical protein
MAYVTTNPPALQSSTLTGSGKVWSYRSTDVFDGTVDGAGYITNAQELGMTVGDSIFVYNTTSSLNKVSHGWVDAVSSTGATLSIESS